MPQFATTGTEWRNDTSLQGDDGSTTEEAKKGVDSMRNGKVLGLNGIQIEIIKH